MGLRDMFGRQAQPDTVAVTQPEAPAPAGGVRPQSARLLPQRTRGEGRWVPAGQTVVVDGRQIAGGLLYFGSNLLAVDGISVEPAAIDPTLRVAWSNPDHEGAVMGYWPSYSQITPNARAAYLSWLASGRRHQGAYIGYVFLYFYGLERRLVADLASDLGGEEAAALVIEVEELLGVYGSDRSFRQYASSLLEYVNVSSLWTADMSPPVWDPSYRGWELPMSVRIGVGRFVAAGQPLPASWALALLRYHPDAALRTPATRCMSEFDELFTARYHARFGDGLNIRPPSQKVTFSYRAASAGFRGRQPVQGSGIPDISTATGPIDKLKDLAGDVTDELDAYSRFLGRRPGAGGTPAALALLPDELVVSRGGETVARLRRWVDSRLDGQQSAVVEADELVEQWSPNRVDKLVKADAVSVASLLAKLNVGIEPDVRFGSATLRPGTPVVLFRLPPGAPASPSPAYTAGMSLAQFTALVAATDGTVTAQERDHLIVHAEHVLGLDAAECARLEAHLRFLTAGKVSMAGMKRRVEGLPAAEREAIGRFMIDVAAADGMVSPAEISTLTKLFGHLGLAEADVYRQVHALGKGDDGPVTVEPGSPTTRWTVPHESETLSPLSSSVKLDPSKVQARLAETAHVAALLNDIFADDAPSIMLTPPTGLAASLPPPGAATQAPAGVSVWGLDVAHSAVVLELVSSELWSRADAETLVASHGLTFLDVALETINEAAFDVCAEPLVEGDDPLEVNTYAAQEIKL